MDINYEELKAWQDDARRMLKNDIEQLKEELEQKLNLMRLMELTDELLSKIDHLNSELQDERAQRQAAEVKLSELNKLTAGVARKSPQDDILKAMRNYLKISKRKNLAKREAAKMVLTELCTSTQMDFPEDIMESLSHLDDEQTDPKVVNVAGNYNDIHENNSVNGILISKEYGRK
jgi:hypothetical protein